MTGPSEDPNKAPGVSLRAIDTLFEQVAVAHRRGTFQFEVRSPHAHGTRLTTCRARAHDAQMEEDTSVRTWLGLRSLTRP